MALAVSEAVGFGRPIEALVGAAAATGWNNTRKGPKNITRLFEETAVTDGAPLPLWKDDAPECKLYGYILGLAQATERSTFERAARKDVSYEHAFDRPQEVRGEVIRVEGILRKLKRVEAPEAAKAWGVDQIYIGWVFDPKNPQLNRPWYVVFTRLPTKFDFKDRPNCRVTFDGYFFKRLRFEVEERWFDAPLVIGRTPALVNELPTAVAYRRAARPRRRRCWPSAGPSRSPRPGDRRLQSDLARCRGEALGQAPRRCHPVRPQRLQHHRPGAGSLLRAGPLGLVRSHRLLQPSGAGPQAPQRSPEESRQGPHLRPPDESMRKVPGRGGAHRGRLARVRRFDPSRFSKPEGINAEYEGWIYDPKSYASNPMCVYFSELPTGVEVNDTLSVPVKFDGYFFKALPLQDDQPQRRGLRNAPLLIGRTVEVTAVDMTPVEHGITINKDMITAFLGMLVVTMTLALGIAFFYRRGDRATRSRIAGVRALNLAEMPDNGPAGAYRL